MLPRGFPLISVSTPLYFIIVGTAALDCCADDNSARLRTIARLSIRVRIERRSEILILASGCEMDVASTLGLTRRVGVGVWDMGPFLLRKSRISRPRFK